MVNQELINYISSNMRRGVSYEDIQSALLARGHSDYDIMEAVKYINGVGDNQQDKSSPSRNFYGVKSGLKYFFLGFFCLVLLIVVAIILIPMIKESKPNVIVIPDGPLSEGQSFDLLKNNVIQFELGGEKSNFTVKAKDGILTFLGSDNFILTQGKSNILDVDLDGVDDYVILALDEKKISIKSVCHESWTCSGWGDCSDGMKKRTCTDFNKCGTIKNKPMVIEVCEEVVVDTPVSAKNETVVKVIELLSCGFGFEYDKKDYCTGKVKTISNSTGSLTCCMGQVVDRLEFSDSLRSVWTSINSSGNCSGDFYDAIIECSPHKCLSEDGILYKGILGISGNFCAYYEELVDNKELYCEYDGNDRKNIAGYYFSESKATEVVHNSSGTFLDGKLTRNYPQEAINSGVCQVLK